MRMQPVLTSVQLRALAAGDRVSRLTGPGNIETAPVASTTAIQIVVRWPSGDIARYLRETGRRAGCPGEVLRQAEPLGKWFCPRCNDQGPCAECSCGWSEIAHEIGAEP